MAEALPPPPLSLGPGRALSRVLVTAAVGLVAAGFFSIEGDPSAEAKEAKTGKRASAKSSAKPGAKDTFEYGCRVQKPQVFLERRTFVTKGLLDGGKHTRAIRYFAERYGHADDEVTMRYTSQSARSQVRIVKFMGLPLSIHSKVAPALACVEKRLTATCTGRSHYKPLAIGGLRAANTYRGAEISNHLFGIAIDIDPDKNPCCGCVDPWPSSPLCKNREQQRSVYERTALPKCWVRAFERFGFDWLGHDDLEDTMHFEFLGDPDRIKR